MFKSKAVYQCMRNTLSNKTSTQSRKFSQIKFRAYTLNTSLQTHTRREFFGNKNISTSTSTVFQSSTMSGDIKANDPLKEKKHTNKLSQSKSPYLLQHAHNPVDWYPWNEEALERAKRENKLIFLSVGYSTCHWCHVMERESFENETVAAIMNEHFINIKVDREERPDIDKIYMQFLLLTKGSGGWPMNVWLTPDLSPILAGTYFPPTKSWGLPSFTAVLENIAKKWETDKESLQEAGSALLLSMQQSLTIQANEDSFAPLQSDSTESKLKEALNIFKQRFDQANGGFGSHPKFPEVSRLNFLFHSYIVTKDVDLLDMVIKTLNQIGRGGINDHVFGGFARYAVDRNWHVPHFEKMLYDQGQLMAAYANGYKITHNKNFLFYADNIFRYLTQTLRHPLGGFYAGEDADSLPTHNDLVKVEGAFYAWSSKDIETAIKQESHRYKLELSAERLFDIYAFHYGVLPNGNVEPQSDPHGHIRNKNILIVRGTKEDACAKFNITEAQLETVLKVTNEILYELRQQRPRPHLDTKIICAWNGLVLSGLSKLANCGSSKRDEYLQAAKTLVGFVREHFFDSEKNRLLRSCYGQSVTDETIEINAENIFGFLDDYAFLIKGLLDYYKASLDYSVLCWAKNLQNIQDSLFWDNENGAYFFSETMSNVVLRIKDDHDGAEPSGNSVSARNLILLSHYYNDENYRNRAEQIFKYFSNTSGFGYALPEMMSALLLHTNGLDLVAVVGPDSPNTTQFVEICRKFYIPGMIILHVNPHNPEDSCNQHVQKKFKMVNGKTTVYICHDRICQMPVTDPTALEENLTQNFFRQFS